MPRSPRVYTDEGVFHILARGNNKQAIFHDASDFVYYKNALKRLKDTQPFKLYHWCLMTNHIHLVVETNPETALSTLMKRLNLSYYAYYKRKYGYSGHFWQDRFKSILMDTDSYLIACGLYVERNPVRAGMVKSAKEYPHSSYSFYAYGKNDAMTDEDPMFKGLGKSRDERALAYKNLKTDAAISPATFNQLFLGSDDFVKSMEKKLGVKNVRLERGRPKSIK